MLESAHLSRRQFQPHLLDVVVRECSSILKLLAGEDQSLLVGWDSFLILDFALNIVDCVG